METRCLGPLRPRLSCRGRARELVAVLGAGALLVGCTTTHALGRIDDDGVRRQVDAIAGNGDAIARVRPLPGAHPPPFGERVTGVLPQGLIIEPTPGQALLVAREQVTSLSRYRHARGAADGAIAGSIAGFVVGLALGVLQTVAEPRCTDFCDASRPPRGGAPRRRPPRCHRGRARRRHRRGGRSRGALRNHPDDMGAVTSSTCWRA